MSCAPGAHGHSASDVVGEPHELSAQIKCSIVPRTLQHPFHRTLNFILSYPFRPLHLARVEQFRHAELLHESPVRAVRGGYEPGGAVREPIGECERRSG